MVEPRRDGGRSRRRRLSRSADFERVYRQGRSRANRFLVLYAFPREAAAAHEDDGSRLGLSVSRRVGGAVDRTRVKRVLREAFWQEADRLPQGADYVVVARPEAKGLAEREGTAGVREALAELVDGLGGATAAGRAAPDAIAAAAGPDDPGAGASADSGASGGEPSVEPGASGGEPSVEPAVAGGEPSAGSDAPASGEHPPHGRETTEPES